MVWFHRFEQITITYQGQAKVYFMKYVSGIFNNLLNNSFLILNLTHFPSAFQKFMYFEGTCISFLVPCAITFFGTFFKISVLKPLAVTVSLSF